MTDWKARCEELTDEELLELYRGAGTFSPVEFAREAIAADRARRPAPAPAAGEVGELVSLIRKAVRAWVAWEEGAVMLNNMTEVQLTRAADLLEQRHPAPVPVSERSPGPEDCDGQGRVWVFGKVEKEWRLVNAKNPGVPHLRYCFSHWLPFHALPLPQGEVK